MRDATIRIGAGFDGHREVDGLDLRVRDGRIVERGAAGTLAGGEVVDLTDHYVTPGLVDAHVHLNSQGGRSLAQCLATPYSLELFQAVANGRELLRHGVTAARDLSGVPTGFRDALAAGLAPGPRLRVAVTPLGRTGGHGDRWTRSGVDAMPEQPEVPSGLVDGPLEVKKLIRVLMRLGVDCVKVYASGGVTSSTESAQAAGLDAEELDAAVRTAAEGGRAVASHATSLEGARLSVRAGVHTLEHGMYLDDDLAADMVARGTFLVPTLVAPLSLIRRGEAGDPAVPAATLAKARAVADDHRVSLALALARGVRIAVGSDAGSVPYGSGTLQECVLLAEAGLAPDAVLRAVTTDAAAAAGFSGGEGSLDVGAPADLIAWDASPIADPAVLGDPRRQTQVRQGGVVVAERGALRPTP
ncbi:amidohydrolase family protein [Propioniciclava coleopterorum]|uniref:Amidohydrolase family protein n=1 Tax=Propioniciclava coleopterorum TaxID=2714937 RepID=A0A6G7Y7K5_9ACTN|nr:amidohydrolase family protein [Propioniciclava coleopterorum]QIK72611.1 amidohydrolase family protein [Propioniciclava coleopterorum]